MKTIGKILLLALLALGVYALVGSAPVHASVPPDATVLIPEGDVPLRSVCAPGEYRQSYAPDAPCGPTDPCLEEGTTLWHLEPCDPGVVAVADPPLPATGSDELTIALCALGITLVGCSLLLARRV